MSKLQNAIVGGVRALVRVDGIDLGVELARLQDHEEGGFRPQDKRGISGGQNGASVRQGDRAMRSPGRLDPQSPTR